MERLSQDTVDPLRGCAGGRLRRCVSTEGVSTSKWFSLACWTERDKSAALRHDSSVSTQGSQTQTSPALCSKGLGTAAGRRGPAGLIPSTLARSWSTMRIRTRSPRAGGQAAPEIVRDTILGRKTSKNKAFKSAIENNEFCNTCNRKEELQRSYTSSVGRHSRRSNREKK